MAKKYTAAELHERIHTKYSDPQQFVVLHEVASGTGFVRDRIDVLVFNLWRSGGLTRSAFEVKVSRGDFLSELKNPEKNIFFRKHCHQFWYVATPEVIKEEELPSGCGWMKPRGGGLSIVRHAAQNDNAVVDDLFMAAIARSMQNEMQDYKDNVRQKVLESDRGYKRAKMFETAVKAFAGRHHCRFLYGDTVDELVKRLEDCVADDDFKKSKNQVLANLRMFQKGILELIDHMTILGTVGLLECEEAGDFLLRSWGAPVGETRTLAQDRLLKEQEKKKSYEDVEELKKSYVAVLNRAKELLEKHK